MEETKEVCDERSDKPDDMYVNIGTPPNIIVREPGYQ